MLSCLTVGCNSLQPTCLPHTVPTQPLPAAASPAPALQALVVWVLLRVLPEHRHWRYALRAERWRLAGLCLRLVRLALLSAPSPEAEGSETAAAEGGSAIAAAVAAVLQYDVGMSACLLAALPYHAEQLEVGGGDVVFCRRMRAAAILKRGGWLKSLPSTSGTGGTALL